MSGAPLLKLHRDKKGVRIPVCPVPEAAVVPTRLPWRFPKQRPKGELRKPADPWLKLQGEEKGSNPLCPVLEADILTTRPARRFPKRRQKGEWRVTAEPWVNFTGKRGVRIPVCPVP